MKNNTRQILETLQKVVIWFVLASLGTMFLVIACHQPRPQTTEVFVLWDITEPHQPVPEARSVLQLYGLDKDPSRGAIFRFSFVNDLQLNQETVFELPASAQNVLSNQFDRKREIDRFVSNVTAFLDSLAMDTVGREQSALYVPIAQTVNILAQSSSDRKILLLYSDLRENTARLSFYDKRTIAQMQADSARLASTLESEEPLGELSGIEVYILYQPRDVADDVSFATVSRFYRGLFTAKGATVTVAASLNP